MNRTVTALALVAFAVLLAGCLRSHAHDRPFAGKPKQDPPPPYSAGAQKPLGNQSPLALPGADAPRPVAPDELPLVPPRDEPPAKDAKPAAGTEELKALLAAAAKAWKGLDNFEAQLTRRELNPKGKTSNEVLLFQFRRDPMAVYTKNVGEASNGRELIYFPSKHGDKMYVKLGKGDPFPGAGFVAPAISPDDKRVTDESRYSIRSIGFDRTIDKLIDLLAKVQDGKLPADTLVYEGQVKREEYPYPLVGVTQKIKAGDDPLFPKGGTRHVYFDMKKDSMSYGLPVLSFATDDTGKEVEYYLFDKVKSPAGLTDADFNPDRRKKKN